MKRYCHKKTSWMLPRQDGQGVNFFWKNFTAEAWETMKLQGVLMGWSSLAPSRIVIEFLRVNCLSLPKSSYSHSHRTTSPHIPRRVSISRKTTSRYQMMEV